MAITRRQRDHLYQTFTYEGLDMGTLDWAYEGDRFEIRHGPTESVFRVNGGPDIHFAVTSYVTDGRRLGPINYDQWASVLAGARDWAHEVSTSPIARIIWAELRKSREILATTEDEDADNSRFTADQHAQIAARIEDIKQQTREMPELTAEQIVGIEQKLDELVRASKRVGRKDWIVMLQGTAYGMLVTDAVPPCTWLTTSSRL